jgi:hypothetical protein
MARPDSDFSFIAVVLPNSKKLNIDEFITIELSVSQLQTLYMGRKVLKVIEYENKNIALNIKRSENE